MPINQNLLNKNEATDETEKLLQVSVVQEHQHEMLSFLNTVSREISNVSADQNARLNAISEGLLAISGNLHATPYSQNLDKLKEHFKHIIQNTVFKDYNELTNELDHLGLETSITNQMSNPFHLKSTKPASYFQLHMYFAHLISSILAGKETEMRELPSPLPLIYACINKILLGLKQYPKHNDPDEGLRIAKRDIEHFEVYDARIAEIETLIWHARDPKVLNRVITEYLDTAIALYTAIGKETYKKESDKTNEIHGNRIVCLSKKHDEEMARFRKAFDVSTYDWFTGQKIHEWRDSTGKRFIWVKIEDPYADEIKRKEHVVLQTKHIQSAIDYWSDKISESQTLAAQNHLSTTASATISSYHGARFLKPTQPNSPYLPAPDPLLPANHPQLEVMRVLQEAQAYGLGSIELFYNTFEETKTFVIDIMFQRVTAPADSPEPIATLTFPYDPLPGYNREEAIWYEWVGNPEFIPQLEGVMESKVISGTKPSCPWEHGCGYGHRNGEGEYIELQVKMPKPPIVKVGKLTQLQNEHSIPLTVQEDLLTAIKSAIQVARQKFIDQTREQLSNSLGSQMQNPLGRLCSDFEKASHHLYGILSYAYFDEMQNPESPLVKWFTSHATNIQQLRHALLTESPQDLLKKLSADLPKLQEIISALPASSLHFHLLSETRLVLQGFLQLYTPYAVEYNDQVPPLDQSKKVKKTSVRTMSKFMEKLLEDGDRKAIKEILQRMQDKWAADAHVLPAPDMVPRLNDIAVSSHTVESTAQKKPSEPEAQQISRESGQADSAVKETSSTRKEKEFIVNNNGGQTLIAMDSILAFSQVVGTQYNVAVSRQTSTIFSPQHVNLSGCIVSKEVEIPSDSIILPEPEISAELLPATIHSSEESTFAKATGYAAETWSCEIFLSDQLICKDVYTNRMRIVTKMGMRESWEDIRGDHYTNCEMLDVNGMPVRHCVGEKTEFVELAAAEPPVLSTIGYAAASGAVSAALPEAIGDALFLMGYVGQANVERIKTAANLVLIAATGSYLSAGVSYTTSATLTRMGCSPDRARVAGNTAGFFVNLARNCTPVGIAATAMNYAAGRFGLWAEKKVVRYVSDTPQRVWNIQR